MVWTLALPFVFLPLVSLHSHALLTLLRQGLWEVQFSYQPQLSSPHVQQLHRRLLNLAAEEKRPGSSRSQQPHLLCTELVLRAPALLPRLPSYRRGAAMLARTRKETLDIARGPQGTKEQTISSPSTRCGDPERRRGRGSRCDAALAGFRPLARCQGDQVTPGFQPWRLG